MPGPSFTSKQPSAKSPRSDERRPSVRKKPARASNFVQPKLAVGKSDDAHEREADRAAAQVVSRKSVPEPERAARGVRRVPADEREREPPRLSRVAMPSAGAGGGEVPAEVEARIEARRGGGRPLDPAARTEMEQGFQRDFSSVRIHDDPSAAALSHELGARAFTLGNDVFFASGEHAPSTEAGRTLLAHELTHTVQQTGSAVSRSVQRVPTTSSGAVASPTSGAGTGAAPVPAPTIDIPVIKIPTFKADAHRGALYREKCSAGHLARPQGYSSETRGSTQSANWMAAVPTEALAGKFAAQLGAANAGRVILVRPKHPTIPTKFDIGTAQRLAEQFKRPRWNASGHERDFHVDHIVEMQLGGVDTTTNYEMLEAKANMASGRAISAAINAAVDALPAPSTAGAAAGAQHRPSSKSIKADYQLRFLDFKGEGEPSKVDFWKLSAIQTGEHVDFTTMLDVFDAEHSIAAGPFHAWTREVEAAVGANGKVPIYRSARGGVPRSFDGRPGTTVTNTDKKHPWIRGFEWETLTFHSAEQGDRIGTLRGAFFKSVKGVKVDQEPADVPVLRFPGLPHAAYLDTEVIRARVRAVFASRSSGVTGASPVELDFVDVDEQSGIVAEGRVLSDVPMLRDADIRIAIEGNDARIQKTFATDELAIPGPIRLDECSLTLSLGSETGVRAAGLVAFSIDRLGRGTLDASAHTGVGQGAGFALSGRFEFDPALFDAPSYVELAYRDGKFSGGGQLTIGRKRVRGVKSATVQVAFDEENFSATGDAQLDIPGVQRGTIAITRNETEGFVVGGAFQLADDIPGLRGGALEVKLQKKPDAEGWAVFATGTAQPNVPGVDTTLTVAYADGLLTIVGSARYERGMLKGGVTLGATNRAIGPDGQPTGDPGDEVRVYGGGQLTIRIAPWLQGTVGVRILPNGEIEVIGEVALPSTLDVFPEQKLAKNLLDVHVDIPIVGVSVAGQRIGIFATIGGALDFDAGFGPGQLQNCRLGVTYNPAHEDQTHVVGGAEFVIPAHAGLKLTVHGGLGVGIPVVSATAQLAVTGELGLAGAARAAAEVDWTPSTGLRLDALGEIFVEPKFAFRVFGMVDVIADLWITEIELYHEEWDLANFEYGSNLRFGVRFPVQYREGEPFELSLDRIELVYPHIEPRQLLEGLVDEIT